MRIVNGKWQDNNSDSVNDFNIGELLEIRNNVTNLYGKNISYTRINLIASLKTLTPRQENDLAFVLSHTKGISKLSGY